MGSACCIAARDRRLITGSRSDVMLQNSPSYTVKGDNSQSTGETAYASEVGYPLESNTIRQSDQSSSLNPPEANKSTRETETPLTLEPSPSTLPDRPPRSCHIVCHIPSNRSPRYVVSKGRGWTHNSKAVSPYRSLNAFSSFNSTTGTVVSNPTCGICFKFLSEKSFGVSQQVNPARELAAVAILLCGHVYHAECLENMTPGTDKYDPTCPVCAFGENKVFKKALRAEVGKVKKSRAMDGGDSGPFDRRSKMKSLIGKPFFRIRFSLRKKVVF